ncbi:response regulator [Candidatus Omnitrophota bacterium]
MPNSKILIVDDDPDILDILKITLNDAGYETIDGTDGEAGLHLAKTTSPNLVILDYNMPKLSGIEVVAALKKDILLRHLPIIMLTGKGEVTDKVDGINAGADDYIVKPFDPQELLARIKMLLRRSERDLDANPLTHLPGNVSIMSALQRYIDKKSFFAVGYVDLNKFKVYNDKYGFEHGDDVIRDTARIMLKAVKERGNPDDFAGHIGGDDFVFITSLDKADALCEQIIQEFDKAAPLFYSEEDRAKGFIVGKDRKGNIKEIPLLSIAIGVVTNESRTISHVAEIGEIGAELKEHAKSYGNSSYVKDKRKDT